MYHRAMQSIIRFVVSCAVVWCTAATAESIYHTGGNAGDENARTAWNNLGGCADLEKYLNIMNDARTRVHEADTHADYQKGYLSGMNRIIRSYERSCRKPVVVTADSVTTDHLVGNAELESEPLSEQSIAKSNGIYNTGYRAGKANAQTAWDNLQGCQDLANFEKIIADATARVVENDVRIDYQIGFIEGLSLTAMTLSESCENRPWVQPIQQVTKSRSPDSRLMTAEQEQGIYAVGMNTGEMLSRSAWLNINDCNRLDEFATIMLATDPARGRSLPAAYVNGYIASIDAVVDEVTKACHADCVKRYAVECEKKPPVTK